MKCIKHGGTSEKLMCDECMRDGVDPCSCGSPARRFGEALMTCIMCESKGCREYLGGVAVDFDLRPWWNSGARGAVWTRREAFRTNIHFLNYQLEHCRSEATKYHMTGEIGKPLHPFSEARWRNMLKQILGDKRCT